jgi:hypothetical protein
MLRMNQVLISLAYCVLLSWVYLQEIVPNWAYMGFYGKYSLSAACISLIITIVLSLLAPMRMDARSIILNVLQFLFFIPYSIYLSYSMQPADHYAAFLIVAFCLYISSGIRIKSPRLPSLSEAHILYLSLFAICAALAMQAFFGGMSYFNLSIDRVYEFRREAAAQLPAGFGYIYSNLSSALIPLALVLSFRTKKGVLFCVALCASVILFGMSHQKSVLFGPIVVAMLYIFFGKVKSVSTIGLIFLALPVIFILEIFQLRILSHSHDAAYLTSLIGRRVLFVPPMLDGFYLQYFHNHPLYYWSNSLAGSWAGKGAYDVTAPFVIGFEYFNNLDTSANTGIIGSGFANAGLLGVALYAMFAGCLLSLLNSYGKKIGHPFVAAAGLTTIVNILMSTDILTAILTHGMLLLIMLLAVFPERPLVNARLRSLKLKRAKDYHGAQLVR